MFTKAIPLPKLAPFARFPAASSVSIRTMSNDAMLAYVSQQTHSPKLLTLGDVGYMDFHYGHLATCYCIPQCHTRMGISSCVQYHASHL